MGHKHCLGAIKDKLPWFFIFSLCLCTFAYMPEVSGVGGPTSNRDHSLVVARELRVELKGLSIQSIKSCIKIRSFYSIKKIIKMNTKEK